MKIKRALFITAGLICFVIGTIGVFLPLLPSFPFYLATAFFFSRSSEKLDNWFKSTKLYKDNLESYIKGEGMTMATKLKIMAIVSALFAFAIYMMRNVLVGQIVVFIVWLFHILYFTLRVKTIKQE